MTISQELSAMDARLAQAVECIVSALKLRSDFKVALVRYFEEHPDGQPSLFEYAKNTPVSFKTLPPVIREAFAQYLHSVQKTAEMDVVARREKTPYDMTIQPTAYLGACNQVFSIDDMSGSGLGGFNYLHVHTQKNFRANTENKNLPWVTFFSVFQNLLELIGQQSTDRVAVIDACDVPIDSRNLGRLAGYLKLYQWEPYLILNENSLPDKDQLLKCLLEICEGSGVRLQFRLDYSSLKKIGTRELSAIFKSISQATVSVIIFYILDPGEESRKLLQDLLAEPAFNELCPSVYTEMRETSSGRVMPRDFNFYWSAYLSTELAVNLSGEVRLSVRNQPVPDQAQLSDPGWKAQILEWHRLYTNKLNHAQI